MKTEFQTIGYHIDYLIEGSYQGSIKINEPDRETFGYNGRIKVVLTQDTIVKKGTKEIKLKAGTEVVTELFPLNGRLIKSE